MKIRMIAVGKRMSAWVQDGFSEYVKRLPREMRFELVEIEPGNRGSSGNAKDAIEKEGARLLAATKGQNHVVALDERGQAWSTQKLSTRLDDWMREGTDIDLLIGGADGLSRACKDRANQTWSLSALTLPHAMVRVVVAEQLYRASTILQGHPYHRA